MLGKLLVLFELLFLLTFWWQTRLNLREWWPDFFTIPLNSDYVTPFVYLSDIFLITLIFVWVIKKVTSVQRPATRIIVSIRNTFGVVRSGSFVDFNQATLTPPVHPSPVTWLKQPRFWLMVFVVAAAVSLMVNQVGWWGWYGWVRLVEGVLLALYVGQRLQNSAVGQRYVAILVVGLVGESLLLVGEWMGQRSLGLQWIGEWRFDVFTPGIAKITFQGGELLRAHGTFPHPNVAGGVIALGIAVVLWHYCRIRDTGYGIQLERIKNQELRINGMALGQLVGRVERLLSRPWVVGVVLGLLGLGLLVTFSRSAWLVGLMGVMLVWFTSRRPKIPQVAGKWWAAAGGVVLMVGLVFGPLVYSRFVALDSIDALSVERRIQLVTVASDLWQESPWLGVGLNNFVPQLAGYGPLYGVGIWREPVHNLLLLITAEVGTIGLVAWLLFMITLLGRMIARLRKDVDGGIKLLLILWAGLFLLAMVDHYWWTSQQGRLVMWLLVGASLAVPSRTRQEVGDRS